MGLVLRCHGFGTVVPWSAIPVPWYYHWVGAVVPWSVVSVPWHRITVVDHGTVMSVPRGRYCGTVVYGTGTVVLWSGL